MDVQRQLSGRCEEPTGWMTFHGRRPRAQHKTNALHRAAERLAASTSARRTCRGALLQTCSAWLGGLPDPPQPCRCLHPGIRYMRSSARGHGYFCWLMTKRCASSSAGSFFFKCKFQTGTMASIYDLVEIIRTKEQAGFVFVVPHWTWWSAS